MSRRTSKEIEHELKKPLIFDDETSQDQNEKSRGSTDLTKRVKNRYFEKYFIFICNLYLAVFDNNDAVF